MNLQNNVQREYLAGCGFAPLLPETVSASMLLPGALSGACSQPLFSSEEAPETETGNDSLDEAAKGEREYVRRRLRDEIGREPSEEEVDEWLRRHTEGY